MPQFTNVEVPLSKVFARLGFAHGITAVDSKTQELIEEEIVFAKRLIMPKQVIASAKILFSGSIVSLDRGFSINSKSICNLLSKSSQVYAFAITIGPHFESKRNDYIAKKETARALILDAIGSETAEMLADITNKQISQEAGKAGLKTTKRFSPGYGDWGLENQKAFLNWLGAENIGIKLNESFQMIPEKSVSAIIGAYK